jgi:hypothetical protein
MIQLKCVLAAMLAGLLLGAGPAYADTKSPAATAAGDVHCVVIGLLLVRSTDTSAQTAGLIMTYYYLGRLDGRTPKPDLEHLISVESKKMTPADVQADQTRCGSELDAKSRALQQIGQHATLGAQPAPTTPPAAPDTKK